MNPPAMTVPAHDVYPARKPAHAAPSPGFDDDTFEIDERPDSHRTPVVWQVSEDLDEVEDVEIDLGRDVVDLTRAHRHATSNTVHITDVAQVADHANSSNVIWTIDSEGAIDIDNGHNSGVGDRVGVGGPIVTTRRVGTHSLLARPLGILSTIRRWIRRHAAVQIAAPCLGGVIVGSLALALANGAAQRFGQVIVTAALVTMGLAWAQSVQDQRRRQQDLRFRLASGNLERADLSGTVLDGFTLWGQNLRGAQMSGCSADHALLSGADLREASIAGASLRATSLCGADLSGIRAYRADLSAADLTNAVATGAIFEQAVLRGARLEGADLTDTDLSGCDLRGATHDESTIWAGVIVSAETHLPEDLDLSMANLLHTI